MKTAKIVALSLVSIILLSGCSTLRFGYYYADWFIVNKIDNFFDLDRSQKKRVNEIVDQLHDWHRTEEIPRLITLLDQAQSKIATELKEEDIEWLAEESIAMKARIFTQVADGVAALLTTLTVQQIDHLEASLVEHNEEEAESYAMPLDEWEDEQKDRFVDRLDDWFGDLSSKQEEDLIAVYGMNRAVHMRYHQQSVIFQNKFVALLRQKPSAEEIKDILSRWILEPESVYSAEYAKFRDRQKAHQLTFYLKLDHTITQSQRQHAIQKLEDYQLDFEAIYMSSL